MGFREVWKAARARRKALRAEIRRFTVRQRRRGAQASGPQGRQAVGLRGECVFVLRRVGLEETQLARNGDPVAVMNAAAPGGCFTLYGKLTP